MLNTIFYFCCKFSDFTNKVPVLTEKHVESLALKKSTRELLWMSEKHLKLRKFELLSVLFILPSQLKNVLNFVFFLSLFMLSS